MRIGKWAESKLVFGDTTIGKRGIQQSPANVGYYRKVFTGKIIVPASSTAGTGGSTRVLKATHGLDSIVGGIATIRNKSNTSSIFSSVINASTIMFQLPGYTAATQRFDVLIWGTAS